MANAQQMLRAVTVAAGAQQPRCSGAPLRPPVALRPAQAALAARLAAAAAQRRGSSSSSRRCLAPRAVAAAEKVEELTIEPVRVIEGHVKLPGSKSLSNRILLLAALAEGTTTVENILVSAPAGQADVGQEAPLGPSWAYAREQAARAKPAAWDQGHMQRSLCCHHGL